MVLYILKYEIEGVIHMADHLKSDFIVEEKISMGNIPAILFRPKNKEGLLPTAILYHGWSSNKEFQRMRGFILSSAGYQVIIPDAIYHGERNPLKNYNLENAKKYFWHVVLNNIEESKIIIEQAVSKYQADPARIGILGHSMGGFTAAGVFTHNLDIKALVVFNGACNWNYFNQWFKGKGWVEEDFEFEEEERVSTLDPQNNLKLLKDRPILLLHGDRDGLVPIEGQRIFYSKIKECYKNPKRIKLIEYPNLNHFVTTNMMEEAIYWFYKYL